MKKLPKALSPEQCFGISMHSALSKWGKMEMERNSRSVDRMQESLFNDTSEATTHRLTPDHLRSLWHESFVNTGYDSKVAADFDRARGEMLITQFYEWWKKEERRVIGIEKSFGLHIDSKEIKGRFDRVEELQNGTLRIIDFKTFKVRSQEEVDQDLQLSLYALAAKEELKKEVSELVMLFLVDESLVEIVTTRGAGELQTAAKTIELLSERLLTKDYTPIPGLEKCRACPYRRICPASMA